MKDLTIFKSKSEPFVKVITWLLAIILIAMLINIIKQNDQENFIWSIVPFTIILFVFVYYGLNSVLQIELRTKQLVIKKFLGEIIIDLNSINQIERLSSIGLNMTIGSKGVFGFIGETMENSKSYVKDRSLIVKIKTLDKQYLISCERADDLVYDLRKVK